MMNKLLLLGDSLVAGYDWQNRMPGYMVLEFGIPGIMTADLLDSLDEIKLQAQSADLVLVMIGTNDLLTGNVDFLKTLKSILVQLTRDFAGAEVVVTSLFPMELSHLPANTIASLNTHIEALTMRTGCCYLDVHQRFVPVRDQVFEDDGVHITSFAYEIWRRSLLEYIAFLIEND